REASSASVVDREACVLAPRRIEEGEIGEPVAVKIPDGAVERVVRRDRCPVVGAEADRTAPVDVGLPVVVGAPPCLALIVAAIRQNQIRVSVSVEVSDVEAVGKERRNLAAPLRAVGLWTSPVNVGAQQ